jgi:hypothetical protein
MLSLSLAQPLAAPQDAHASRAFQQESLPVCLGPAEILRRVWQGSDLGPLTRALVIGAEAGATGAAMDLATLLMTQGGDLAAEGLLMLRAAARATPSFVIRPGAGLRVLAFVTPGGFMANTPIDFLLADRDVELILHYVDADTPHLRNLPGHDVAFLAVAESPENAAVLARMERLLSGWAGPLMNGKAPQIAALTRAGTYQALRGALGVLTPKAELLDRATLLARPLTGPILLRPDGSHAGKGLALVASAAEVAAWFAETGVDMAWTCPFIDYRDDRGMYVKYRIVLIDGVPYPSHMAISTHWMVHYLNAEMTDHADRRAEEAAWMASFHQDFALRHGPTLAEIARRLDLDYLGLDCAELPDGRLLVFEADVAMIVHDLDDVGLFPYKKPAMRRLFAAFEASLRREARRCGPWDKVRSC